nr:hypothetical protein [Desulfobacterales bacterium]
DCTPREKIKFLLAEYQEPTKEINRRSKEQFLCIAGSIPSLGSVLAFIAKDPLKYSPLLIIVPWILCIFGLLWTDHAHHIFRIGAYIRDKIETQFNEIAQYQKIMGWQHYLHSNQDNPTNEKRDDQENEKRKPSFITYYLPLLYFVLPSLICMLAYIVLRTDPTRIPVPVEVAVLAIGIVLLFAIIVSWRRGIDVVDK